MRKLALVIAVCSAAACGIDVKIRLVNSSGSAVRCLTDIDGAQESFDTTKDFEKSATHGGFTYISCQKQTSGDMKTIRVEALVNDDAIETGTASDEFGIASASVSP